MKSTNPEIYQSQNEARLSPSERTARSLPPVRVEEDDDLARRNDNRSSLQLLLLLLLPPPWIESSIPAAWNSTSNSSI